MREGPEGEPSKSFPTLSMRIYHNYGIIRPMKNKSIRTKFGLFRSESEAQEMCDLRSKEVRFTNSQFHAVKVARNKSGKNSWLAYCLTAK